MKITTASAFLIVITIVISNFAATPLDFDGDGKTDIATTRLLPQANGDLLLEWWIQSSANPNNVASTQFGIGDRIIGSESYQDEIVPRDYDGDGKTDIAVWRAVTAGFFYILRSTDSTVLIEQYGSYEDNPHATADYDGDGLADFGVLRTPDVSHPTNQFIYRGTLNNPSGNLTYVPVNGGVNPSLIPGDFNGDGRADFGVRAKSSNVYHLRFSNTPATETFTFGSSTDFVQTGDYDGDGKTDFAFTRKSKTALAWYILERDGGGTGTLNPIYFGPSSPALTAGETSYFGYDFDGDGRTDLTVTERSQSTGLTFHYRRSSDGVVRNVNFGLYLDSPIRLYR